MALTPPLKLYYNLRHLHARRKKNCKKLKLYGKWILCTEFFFIYLNLFSCDKNRIKFGITVSLWCVIWSTEEPLISIINLLNGGEISLSKVFALTNMEGGGVTLNEKFLHVKNRLTSKIAKDWKTQGKSCWFFFWLYTKFHFISRLFYFTREVKFFINYVKLYIKEETTSHDCYMFDHNDFQYLYTF